MAEFTHKINEGSAFNNERKTEDWHADYTGKINVNGTLHYLNIYTNEGSRGRYFKVQIGKQVSEKKASAPQTNDEQPFNDNIPF